MEAAARTAVGADDSETSVQAASKQGAVSASRSEVVYVHAPSGPYVFTVVTREQGDTSWTPDNAGYALSRAYSRLFWETFEPAAAWHTDAGAPTEEDIGSDLGAGFPERIGSSSSLHATVDDDIFVGSEFLSIDTRL